MMNHYHVAGFDFSIDATEEQLALLTNYAPFQVPEKGANPLFVLRVGAWEMPAEKELFFHDHSDADMPRIEISKLPDGGWMIEEAPVKALPTTMQMIMSPDFSDVKLKIVDEDYTKFALDNAAMLLFAFTTAKKGVLEMHASVTVKDGYGYLFLGKSGTGKSTHSQQWMKAFPEAWLLNDDNPILRLEGTKEDPKVVVYGSPWSGKTPCYKNASAPVGAIVKLSQAPENKIAKLRLSEAYAYMLSSASGLKIVPEMMDALYETIAAIIQTVQLYHLDCLPNTDAAHCCYDAVHA